MLRASALFYAVTVALLVGMVTSALILLVHFRNMETERWLAGQRALANARSAIRLAAASGDPRTTEHALDLFGSGEDSVFVRMRPYGLLDHVAARARIADRWAVESAFAGGRNADARVLVLGRGDGSAVHLCGDARVLGDAAVPDADVRRGYIESRPFTGERLVEGALQASEGNVSLSDPMMLQRIAANCHRLAMEDQWPVPWERAAVPDSTSDPFAPFPLVELTGIRELDGLSFTGPLILRSADTLVLGAGLRLDMVIVQAPFITVAAEAMLVAQCFADQGIHVEQGAKLLYPSALVVMSDGRGGHASVTIDADAVVEGAVVACMDPGDRKGTALVTTRPGTLVRGEVFSEGLLEHRGVLKGTAAAGALILHTASSTYRGYLLDGVLARPEPGIRIGALATGDRQHKDVLRWMPPA